MTEFQKQLKEYVNSHPKLVTKKPAGDGIFILKYKNTVFFKNSFNQFLEECRGTIVDEDFNLVSYPLPKLYNYGIESRAPRIPLDSTVTAYRKINGFFAAATWHNNELLVSTTGTTTSSYAELAKTHLTNRVTGECKDNPDYSYLFEICDPSDPHIIEELGGPYYLGRRKKEWKSKVDYNQLEEIAIRLDCFYPDTFIMTLKELIQLTKQVSHEGFVWTNGVVSAKIKSPTYLVQKAMARKKDILTLDKSKVPEEYFPLLDYLLSINNEFNLMEEQERLNLIRKWLNEQT